VRFTWKDYRQGGKTKVMTLEADEFIRRFLLHALSAAMAKRFDRRTSVILATSNDARSEIMFRRAGSSFLPRLCCRLGLQHGRAPDIAHSFFARCESPSVLGGAHSMTTALSGQQMTLRVWVGAYSCLYFGHSAWLTPW
jgi:Putative transposase